MIKTFTQTDLIRYLYLEITEAERNEIDRALLRDNNLRVMFNEMCAMRKELDEAALQPSETTIMNILNYSRALQTKE